MVKKNKFLTIGIWLGFEFKANMRREGITRYTYSLIESLAKHHDVNIEIWFYSINEREVLYCFSKLQNDYPDKINFFSVNNSFKHVAQLVIDKLSSYIQSKILEKKTEKRNQLKLKLYFGETFLYKKLALLNRYTISFVKGIAFLSFKCIYLISKKIIRYWPSNCINKVNKISKADVFLVTSIMLNNAIRIKKRKVVVIHDLFTIEFAELFTKTHPNILETNKIYIKNAEKFAKQNSTFISHSEHVTKNHVLKFIKNANPSNTFHIYLPVNKPRSNCGFIDKFSIFEKFKIKDKYIIYPTQLRPYKNIEILLKAIKTINNEGIKIKLLLTTDINNSTFLQELVTKLKVSDYLILTGSVTEQELYSLYKYAIMAVTPTLAEGGFPWQTLEALYMEVPTISSDIPVVQERLRLINVNPAESNLYLFNPYDEKQLVKYIKEVYKNPSAIYAKQKETIYDKLFEYNWRDVSNQYINLFKKTG